MLTCCLRGVAPLQPADRVLDVGREHLEGWPEVRPGGRGLDIVAARLEERYVSGAESRSEAAARMGALDRGRRVMRLLGCAKNQIAVSCGSVR